MKALDWLKYLEVQRRRHGKTLFTVTELSNIANTSVHNVNEELRRLVERNVLTRYTAGHYGLPDAVSAEELVGELDSRAYVTGAYALYRHNIITQAIHEIDCFTNRRHGSSRVRDVPQGRMKFICVNSSVYNLPEGRRLAGPEQALLDYVYICRRSGVNARGLVTFRNLDKLDRGVIEQLTPRYPGTVAREIQGFKELKRLKG